jgi:arsenite methyltransferase
MNISIGVWTMAVQDLFDEEKIRKEVRRHYGELAEKVGNGAAASCCATEEQAEAASDCCAPGNDSTRLIYELPEVGELPQEVRSLSAGCGDPVTLAELEPGQVVLDLGSGGGIDCFLAARKVGDAGHVIGVDMTAEMLSQARANKRKVGADNVEFRLGEIEHLPVEDNSIDVILSNCVINLSPDKPQVFREAFRVLRPGGKLAVSDIVADGPLPELLQRDLSSWAGCLAGAIDKEQYIKDLQDAGFGDVEISPRWFDPETASELLEAEGIKLSGTGQSGDQAAMVNLDGEWKAVDLGGRKPPFSARITARKPLVNIPA